MATPPGPSPASTLAGFRAWVEADCPVAPGPLADPRAAPAEDDPRPLADLNPGTARTALRKAVLAARNGGSDGHAPQRPLLGRVAGIPPCSCGCFRPTRR